MNYIHEHSTIVQLIFNEYYPPHRPTLSIGKKRHRGCSIALVQHYLPTMDDETRARAKWTLGMLRAIPEKRKGVE